MRRNIVFLLFVFTLIFLFSCSKKEDKVGRELEDKMSKLLGQIVVELKEPKVIDNLDPRKFVELSAIMLVSNYYWTKELISSNSNVSPEEIDSYKTLKKQQLLSSFGLTLDDYENYSIKNYKELQEFSKENPEVMDLYNEIARSLPTFED
ncbi:MAG: hypothetical protein ACP5PT_08135 [Brevinematia bacterium]